MRKIAVATAKAPKARATTLVRLRPDITPKPQNNRSAHPTTMTRSGQEIELSGQVPEENRGVFSRFYSAASYAFLDRAEEAQRTKADLIAKNGEQVWEIWVNKGQVYARTNEQDLARRAFRKLGLRICATEEELKKFENPKRLPECVKT